MYQPDARPTLPGARNSCRRGGIAWRKQTLQRAGQLRSHLLRPSTDAQTLQFPRRLACHDTCNRLVVVHKSGRGRQAPSYTKGSTLHILHEAQRGSQSATTQTPTTPRSALAQHSAICIRCMNSQRVLPLTRQTHTNCTSAAIHYPQTLTPLTTITVP